MALERLQKALARAGVASRRKIEELVYRGRVTINGEVAQPGDKVDLEKDHVKVDGKRIQPLRRPHLYLLLNKPPGYVSTVNDPENRPTVLDLLPDRLHKALFPVGRLDYDSEGLLLLTTDGEFAQKVAHPSSGCTKLYEVKVKGQPDGAALAKLAKGIVLDGRHAAPAWVESFGGPPGRRTGRDNSWFRVALKEGRTRQIREMFFRVGHPVMRLKRTQIGGLADPFLRLGSWRELEPPEIETLLSGVEPARRVERSRARPKVKFEEAPEEARPVKPAKVRPVRRRITAPLEEGAAAPKAAAPKRVKSAAQGKGAAFADRPSRESKVAETSTWKARGRGAEASAAQTRGRGGAPTARAPRERRADEDDWTSTPRRRPAPPRRAEQDDEVWSPSLPAQRLFEEAEFAESRSSFLQGDDENWDEPLGSPRAAGRGDAGAGRGGRGGRPGRGEREERAPRAGRFSLFAKKPPGRDEGEGRPSRARPGAGPGRGHAGGGDAASPRTGAHTRFGGVADGGREGRASRLRGGVASRGPGAGRGQRSGEGFGGFGERGGAGGDDGRPARPRSPRAADGGDRPRRARPGFGNGERPSRPRGGAGYGQSDRSGGRAGDFGGEDGDRRPSRPPGRGLSGPPAGEGRPARRRPGSPFGEPAEGSFRPSRPRPGAGRDEGERPSRPSRPARPGRTRNGAGRGTPAAGGPEDRPFGVFESGRPARPSRPSSGGGRPAGRSADGPRGGGRPAGGRPPGGGRPGGRPAGGGGGRPSRPGGGKPGKGKR